MNRSTRSRRQHKCHHVRQYVRYQVKLRRRIRGQLFDDTFPRTISSRATLLLVLRNSIKFPFSIHSETSAGELLYSANPRHGNTFRCFNAAQIFNSLTNECTFCTSSNPKNKHKDRHFCLERNSLYLCRHLGRVDGKPLLRLSLVPPLNPAPSIVQCTHPLIHRVRIGCRR